MEILLSILYILIFVFVIYKANFFDIEGLSKRNLSVFFVIKILCGIALTFIYTYYYKQRETADIYKYFDDGRIMYASIFNHPFDYLRMVTSLGSESPELNKYYDVMNYSHRGGNYGLYNDYITMIRFNAVINLFSFGYYTVHTIFMAFISFTGLTAIYKTFSPYLQNKKTELWIAVYFIPSILLWTSGVLKESIMMFGLGMLCLSFIKILEKFSLKYFFLLLFSVLILFISKMYILVALLPGIITIFIIQKSGSKWALIKFIFIHAVFLLFAFNITIFQYDFLQILSFKQQDFAVLVQKAGNVGSLIHIPELKPTWISFFENSPVAFFNALVRPHIFEAYSPFVLLSALENLLLILFILTTFFFIKYKNIQNKGLIYLCFSFVVILFILSGLTTPVMGALVRYRAPALPFLIIALLLLFDKEKFISWRNKLFKKK